MILLEADELKSRIEDARELFNECVDLDDPLHQFGLILVVLVPTYVLTSGNNPFAGIPLYQLVALVLIFAVMYVSMNGDGEFDFFGSSVPVEGEGSEQGVSPSEIQVHEGGGGD